MVNWRAEEIWLSFFMYMTEGLNYLFSTNHYHVYFYNVRFFLITDNVNHIYVHQVDYAEFTLPRTARRASEEIFEYLSKGEYNWLLTACPFNQEEGLSHNILKEKQKHILTW